MMMRVARLLFAAGAVGVVNSFQIISQHPSTRWSPTSSLKESIALQESASSSSTDESAEPISSTGKQQDADDSSEMRKELFQEKEKLSMPWSAVQDDALRDNLAKYTVMIPLSKRSQTRDGASSTEVFALWRTMLKELPQLAGYPIDFLQEMHARQIANNQTLLEVTPSLLPYLEDFEFASAGGISGKVYGVPGLADGTRIETSEVANIEVTLPKGFIRTSDGMAAYELGLPKREEFLEMGESVNRQSSRLLNTVNNNVGSIVPQDMSEADDMLLRLATGTSILLAGSAAVSMLSHHLTVNVFWV